MRREITTRQLVVGLVLTFAAIASPPLAAADPVQIEAIQKRIRELEAQAGELSARIAKLEAQIATATEGPERDRLAGELKQAAKDAADAKDSIRYFQALEHQENSTAAQKQADERKARADKATTAEEKTKLLQEADEFRLKADAAHAETTRIMRELAPIDRSGYGLSHLWLVQQLYRYERRPDGKLVPPSPRNILDAERHLIHALASPRDDVRTGAHFGLAKLFRDTNRMDDSKKHLMEVAKVHPEYRLTLAQWAKQQNEPNESIVAHAKAAEDVFKARLATNVNDHEARFGMVECLILMKKFEDAQAAINKGATLATQVDIVRAYARKLTVVLLEWSDTKDGDPKLGLEDRLRLLDQALTLDPDNPELFNRLMKFTKDKSPEADKAREEFKNYITLGKGSAMAHLFLGIDAWQQNDAKEAKYHWEKAFELSKGAPLIANNLAWVLAFSPPEDLPRALELISAAIKQQPDEPRFRGTRGHILAKLDRSKEALPDLEAAISAYPNDVKLYKALAEVCTNLGLAAKAEEYRKKANELRPVNDLPPKRPGDA